MTLTLVLRSRNVSIIEIFFEHVLARKTMIPVLAYINDTLPLQLAPGANLS